MLKKTLCILGMLLSFKFSVHAQQTSTASKTPVKKNLPVFCDCKSAQQLTITKAFLYGETVAPKGFGEKQEIHSGKRNSNFSFEKEHNTAWYKLLMGANGKLSFDIMPEKPDDDYDFMLFRAYSDSLFCDSLHKHHLMPVRANISRDEEDIKGHTGLRLSAGKECIKQGVGEAYCKSMEVKKGEIYYLVLDNVYPGGEGHKIDFYFEKEMELSGTITNDEGQPVKAEIVLSDNKGEEILKTFSDEQTGAYNIKTNLVENKNYSLTMSADSLFLGQQTISTATKKSELQKIKVVLPKLKKGNKYKITSINFFGDSEKYIDASIPSIEALYKLMKKNPGLRIQIEGHTNGCGNGKAYSQNLSERRAYAIKDYLTEHGIESTRILTIGYGCSKMLYPITGTLSEQQENRRVEINVLEY